MYLCLGMASVDGKTFSRQSQKSDLSAERAVESHNEDITRKIRPSVAS